MYNPGQRYTGTGRQATIGSHGRLDQSFTRRMPYQDGHYMRVSPGRNAHSASYMQRAHWIPNYRRGHSTQRGYASANYERRGSARNYHQLQPHRSFQNFRNHEELALADTCFVCGEYLQNSLDPGMHLCSRCHRMQQEPLAHGGTSNNNNMSPQSHPLAAADVEDQNTPESNEETEPDEIEQHIESLLKECLMDIQSGYNNITERLQASLSANIDEIHKMYRTVQEDKKQLAKLKSQLDVKAAELTEKESEIRALQDKIDKSKRTLEEETAKDKEEIARLWQQLRDELERMENLYQVQKGRIKLDVGGHEFTTSAFTLTQVHDSMLAAMFSGRHEIKRESDGSVFIDRDGTHFRYILNYLRDHESSFEALPRNKQTLRELRNEAIFYQLPGLIQQIEKLL